MKTVTVRSTRKRELCLWLVIVLLIGFPILLLTTSFQGHSRFVDRSQRAGDGFKYQSGLFPELYYQEHQSKKPERFDPVAFVQGPWGRCGHYWIKTNLFIPRQTTAPEILAVIEEWIENVPLSFFVKPFLRLSGWKPQRLVIYADGTMSGVVPHEFDALNLAGFVSSDDLRAAKPTPPVHQ